MPRRIGSAETHSGLDAVGFSIDPTNDRAGFHCWIRDPCGSALKPWRFVGSFTQTVSSLEVTCAATYVKAGRSPTTS